MEESKFNEMVALLDAAQDDVAKYNNGNKAAGVRVRKTMQEVKNLAQEIRKNVSAKADI